MLKELNTAFGAVCNAVATASLAVNDGASILRIKGTASKQITALEAVKAISAAKKDCDDKELQAALELLTSVENN